MWTEKTSSVKLYPNCDDKSNYFILPANFEAGTFGGSDQNTDGLYNLYLGPNWWPENTGAYDIRSDCNASGGWQYDISADKFSQYNLAYASGVSEARAALLGDLNTDDLSTDNILGTDTTSGVVDNLNSSYNNFNFDTDNIALLRFGVATSAADNRIGTALQSFGVGTNEGTVNTRFLAELPSSYNNPSISSVPLLQMQRRVSHKLVLVKQIRFFGLLLDSEVFLRLILA